MVDIEGTTTPVSFVYDVLFAYARQGLEGFLARRAADAALRADLQALRAEHAAEARGAPDPPPRWDESDPTAGPAVAYLRWLMDRDRKSTALKAIQGRIWEEGFQAGELRARVYDDVPPAFRRWHARGAGPWIFSSGSVLAQRLLFGHTAHGDLTPLISGYFDTTTGPKQEAPTYGRIAAAIGRVPADVRFVSDVGAEVDAARAAGLRTALCVREGAPAPPDGHRVIRSFDELD
ncbi:MAG TPA: acireductone synthase [Vicinamibacteria bacterium]